MNLRRYSGDPFSNSPKNGNSYGIDLELKKRKREDSTAIYGTVGVHLTDSILRTEGMLRNELTDGNAVGNVLMK